MSERCGWCATPQYQGARICRSCGARRIVEADQSFFGRLFAAIYGGFAGFVFGIIIGWLFSSEIAFIISVIGGSVLGWYNGLEEVKWYR